MNKLFGIVMCGLVLVGCGDKPDAQLETEAKDSVKSELSQKYKIGECEKWQFMETAGVISKGASKVVCDTEFNINKGLVFDKVKIYRRGDHNYVCGNVSGYTDVSTINAQFVYDDRDDGSVSIKKTKSALMMKNDENGKQLRKLEEDLFNLNLRECK